MTRPTLRLRWRRLDAPGEEDAKLVPFKQTWHLMGRVRTEFEGSPALVEYEISCHRDWSFAVAVIGMRWRGTRRRLSVSRERPQDWYVSGTPRFDLSACTDLDLSVTPFTNTIPIRRLALTVGEHADVTAAWVRFPELTVEPLLQRYTRLEPNRYRYESLVSGFVADIETDEDGLVVAYPHLWARA